MEHLDQLTHYKNLIIYLGQLDLNIHNLDSKLALMHEERIKTIQELQFLETLIGDSSQENNAPDPDSSNVGTQS